MLEPATQNAPNEMVAADAGGATTMVPATAAMPAADATTRLVDILIEAL